MISIYLAIGAIFAAVMVWGAIKDRSSIVEMLLIAVVSCMLWPLLLVLICIETFVLLSTIEVVKRRRPKK